MSNNLSTLNDYLFLQMEALTNPDLKGEALTEELARTKGVTDVAKTIVSNAAVALKAQQFMAEERGKEVAYRMLEGDE